ncbi:MAG: SIS domain-containing protein [bacterium]
MLFKPFLTEINKVMRKIDTHGVDTFVSEIKQAKRVFVIGVGRSGLVAKNLAMRLTRIHKQTYVIYETVNPKMRKGDLLIAISGSGETTDIIDSVKISRMMGTKVLGLTADMQSPLAKLAHYCINIPAKIPSRLASHYHLRELIGVPERSATKSLFEICALIFVEVGVSKLDNIEE